MIRFVTVVVMTAALFLSGCSKTEPTSNAEDTKAPAVKKTPDIKGSIGVDFEKKIVRIGALNAETGPAAVLGKPWAIGKRVLAAEVNSGKGNLLPAGWKIELVERDHGYNPSKSQQGLAALKDQVLFFATSFGTPPTMPLRPFLKKDNIIAFPASLSSQMAEFEHTPPIGSPYSFEARRAMDFAAQNALYLNHKQNSHRILCPRPTSGRLQTISMGQFNHRYLLISVSLVSESLAIDFPAQNALYAHHRQNSHRVLCFHPLAGKLQTISMGHV